jgi:hypothetical protein
MTVDEVVLDYADAARNLRELATNATKGGWTEWAYEVIGFASIAERAAEAEVRDREPVNIRCGMCGGWKSCDIGVHQSYIWTGR